MDLNVNGQGVILFVYLSMIPNHMKYQNIFILAFVVINIISCNSTKTIKNNSQATKLDSIVETQEFTIISNWAEPQLTNAMQQVLSSGLMSPGSTAGNISLIGNHNYLTISGDSIKSHLPYFGERQMSIGYGGGDSAIEFKGLMQNYKVKKIKKNAYLVTFTAKSNSENFNVSIQLFPNLKTSIHLSSGTRHAISYTGEIKILETK